MVKTVFSALAVALVVSSLCDARPATSRQLLPPMPGYVPVYIRNGDTPLEDINIELAEAFHAIHSGRSAGRTSIEALEEDPRNDVALIKKNRAALSASRSAASSPKDALILNKHTSKKGTNLPEKQSQNDQKANGDKQIAETKEKTVKESQIHEKKGRAPQSLDDISVVDTAEDKKQTERRPSQVAVRILEKADSSANIQRIPKI